MIDEKKIEKASEKQLSNIEPYGVEQKLNREKPFTLYEKEDVKSFFKAGINWFLENLWHDASEVPKPIEEGMLGVGCLVRYKSGVFEYGEYWFGDGFNKWYDVFANEPIRQELIESWLYIKDLLKGGEG